MGQKVTLRVRAADAESLPVAHPACVGGFALRWDDAIQSHRLTPAATSGTHSLVADDAISHQTSPVDTDGHGYVRDMCRDPAAYSASWDKTRTERGAGGRMAGARIQAGCGLDRATGQGGFMCTNAGAIVAAGRSDLGSECNLAQHQGGGNGDPACGPRLTQRASEAVKQLAWWGDLRWIRSIPAKDRRCSCDESIRSVPAALVASKPNEYLLMRGRLCRWLLSGGPQQAHFRALCRRG